MGTPPNIFEIFSGSVYTPAIHHLVFLTVLLQTPPPPHGLALKLSPQNPSASPVLEVAPLSPIGNFPMQNFPIGKFLMLQSGFRSGATSPYREFPYAEFPYRGIPYALVQF